MDTQELDKVLDKAIVTWHVMHAIHTFNSVAQISLLPGSFILKVIVACWYKYKNQHHEILHSLLARLNDLSVFSQQPWPFT